MEYEMEITERIRDAIVTALRSEIARGWALDQLVPMLMNSVEEAINEIKED